MRYFDNATMQLIYLLSLPSSFLSYFCHLLLVPLGHRCQRLSILHLASSILNRPSPIVYLPSSSSSSRTPSSSFSLSLTSTVQLSSRPALASTCSTFLLRPTLDSFDSATFYLHLYLYLYFYFHFYCLVLGAWCLYLPDSRLTTHTGTLCMTLHSIHHLPLDRGRHVNV